MRLPKKWFIILIILAVLLSIGLVHKSEDTRKSVPFEREVSSLTTVGYDPLNEKISIVSLLRLNKSNRILKTSRKPSNPINETKVHYEKPLIFVHDVTPYYFSELKEVVQVIDLYNYSSKTVLFVIPRFDPPHYGNRWDLRENREFVLYLRRLQKRGYRIELHGYEHTYHEFNCSYDVAKEKLKNATALMSEVGFDNFAFFLPPAWALNNESIKAIREYNLTIVMPDYFILPNGSVERVWNHEYTWYIEKDDVEMRLALAERDYYNTSQRGVPFYLSIHLGVVNYGGGLKFFEEFVKWASLLGETS